MMVVMLSSHGASWTFYETAGDKVFIMETKSPERAIRAEVLEYLVRECRWMFGDRRIVLGIPAGRWIELLHDGTGTLKGMEPYDGPVPQQQDDDDE
jgi:hypothetical protein